MQQTIPAIHSSPDPNAAALIDRYTAVRRFALDLAEPLSPEDCAAQSMPDASPVKWHLAHTTWFFEHFVLQAHAPHYQAFDGAFAYLFNSYYDALGERHPRPLRGLLSRPSLQRVLAYRLHVDNALREWLHRSAPPPQVLELLELGLHHERQHQELLLTDVKHLLFQNPLKPVYRTDLCLPAAGAPLPQRFVEGQAGKAAIGHAGGGFAFDNESPRHSRWLNPHCMAWRPVVNAEYREFVLDRGYRRPDLWLADGWCIVQQRGWRQPIYWDESLECEFTLAGMQPLNPAAPVCHISYYEADAYARWCGARLPDEDEWEAAAAATPFCGNFADAGVLHPRAALDAHDRQYFGDVWEWTGSAYRPYPGFRIAEGAVGEYNGKFMANQMVLRGGSCASHSDHLRPSYRNFFYPDARWQFAGIRLARDV
jgi:ergothioneine biosynthesis protein EgtB